MKRKLTFRNAIFEDTSTIVQFGADTFKAAFGPYHRPEDMAEYLAANFNDEVVQSLIEDTSSYFLLMYEGKNIIAHLSLTKIFKILSLSLYFM